MPKRFTDTDKFKKHFVRGLQPPYKLLWLYITDECSAAGIWEVDIEVAQIRLGVKLKKSTAESEFRHKIHLLDDGKKWFIPSFIEFQYGQLQENNRAHTQIIATLKKFLLLDENLVVKPLTSPLQGDKDMVMDKDKVMEQVMVMDKERKSEKLKNVVMPFETETFTTIWQEWKNYKRDEHKFSYKSIQSEQATLNELATLSGGDEMQSIKIILQSMANGWKGLFALNNSNGNRNIQNQERIGSIRQKLSETIGNIADSL